MIGHSFFLFFKHTHTQSLCFSEAKFCHGDLGVGVEGAWLLILPSIRHPRPHAITACPLSAVPLLSLGAGR